jgi:4-hydroxybenzoate polyprenyltransferase
MIKAARPQQWTKNLIIFAPLIFSQNLFDISKLLTIAAAFLFFCLLSAAMYILNDIQDLEEDRKHPLKSQRPLASGKITQGQAWAEFVILLGLSLSGAFFLGRDVFLIAFFYLVLQIAYTYYLKHVVILDVFVIAAGFILRVAAGGLAIDVTVSHWLLICTLLLALFLAMSKRRHELILLDEDASGHRPILQEYSPYLLDQMIAVVTASTVIAYCLYTISQETVAKFGTHELIYTVPFVIYGIFRYLYLVHQKSGGGTPEYLLLRDRPLLLDMLFWIVSAALIIYL